MGLGLGSVLGAVAYRCSRSAKAREWKHRMCCAANSVAGKAGEWMAGVKEKASEMADDVADKNKYQSFSGK